MATEHTAAQGMERSVSRPCEITWNGFIDHCVHLAERQPQTPHGIFGIPSGGCFVSLEVANIFRCHHLSEPRPGCLIVDDIVDSGRTAQAWLKRYPEYPFDALFRKPHSPPAMAPGALQIDGWIKLPWEKSSAPEDAVVRLLEFLGEDPRREGLRETPDRVVRALAEMTSGYRDDPSKILSKMFHVKHDEMVLVSGIEFWSLCEHHLLPFHGLATVGYIPDGRIVGLSKIPRLVHAFARRLQVQEQLTQQVATALDTELKPLGVGVVMKATHLCMACRGVRSAATMITSCLLGKMLDPAPRSEFLNLAK